MADRQLFLGDPPQAGDEAASWGPVDADVESAPTTRRKRRKRAPEPIDVYLHVADPEVLEALAEIPDPRDRHDFAVAALRVGVLALSQARGQIDADAVRKEGDEILSGVSTALREHAGQLNAALTGALREYLDPQGGKFAQRVQRLIEDDGELSGIMRHHVAGQSSQMAQTLAQHVGDQSPLLRRLDPGHADGVLAQIRGALQQNMDQQRQRVLEQFSLDREDSALSRLVKRITDDSGRLKREFSEDFQKMVAQFSLDDEGSALSRLVRQVDRAQRGIVEQFSLDDEGSALSRLKRELLGSIDALTQQQRSFQQQVMERLSALDARRRTQDEGTAHGVLFEHRLATVVEEEAVRVGDVFTAVGARTGVIRNCKVGDHLVTLGPDSPAHGQHIVFEAKEALGYDDAKALAELDTAKRNRDADVGVFVFSSRVAPTRPPFRRVGSDLLVVWDPEDPQTDVYVRAAVSVARAMVFRRAHSHQQNSLDTEALDRAIAEVERQTDKLETVRKSAEGIKAGAERILDEVRKMREALGKKTAELREHGEAVKRALV